MKKIVCSLAVVAFAINAIADVLLWQVPESGTISGVADPGNVTAGSKEITWQYAMLNATDANELTYWKAGDVDAKATVVQSYLGNTPTQAVRPSSAGQTLAADYTSGKNYYIGLYGSDGSLVGFSELMTNVQNFLAESRFVADWDGVNAMGANGMTYTAAPEPTSGVLLLLGAAVLGLRRRKVA